MEYVQDLRIPPACGGIKGGKSIKIAKNQVIKSLKQHNSKQERQICVSPDVYILYSTIDNGNT